MSGRNAMRSARVLMLLWVILAAGLSSANPASADSTGTLTKCVTDGSISTKLCLRFTYWNTSSSGQTYVELTKVSASVTKLDTFASLLNIKVGESTYGRCLSSCAYINDGVLLANRNPPASGTYYGGSAPWANVYTDVSGGAGYFTCTVASVTWAIHSQTYSYSADYCYGHALDFLSGADRERGLR